MNQGSEIYGLEAVVVDPCRCGCPLLRVHPHSARSDIPIWQCVWCRSRRGRPTAIELALLNAWLREYGYTLKPLAFCDDGGIRFAYEVFASSRAPVAWVNKNTQN
jgi:hypothetical protein